MRRTPKEKHGVPSGCLDGNRPRCTTCCWGNSHGPAPKRYRIASVNQDCAGARQKPMHPELARAARWCTQHLGHASASSFVARLPAANTFPKSSSRSVAGCSHDPRRPCSLACVCSRGCLWGGAWITTHTQACNVESTLHACVEARGPMSVSGPPMLTRAFTLRVKRNKCVEGPGSTMTSLAFRKPSGKPHNEKTARFVGPRKGRRFEQVQQHL